MPVPFSTFPQTYAWDAKNELVSIVYSLGSNSGNHTEFTYDGLGRRVEIVERTGTTVGSGTVTSTKQYVWIGSTIAEERDASGTTVTKRFFPQGEQVPGATSPADKLYYTRDQLGSVRELVNSSGTLVTRYSYDPYGRVTTTHTAANTSTPPIDATFQFTGDYVHATSGLNLTWYRAYDPNTGRWLSRDPLKNAEMRLGPNLYEYVLNNPIDKIDSLGLMFGAVPVIGTIEQAYNVYNNNVNGEKPSDYTAHPELGQTLCENDIDNQAFWKIAAFALPDAPKIGVDVGVGIATTALAPPAGAVVDGVGALDSLSALYIAFVAKDKIQNAANQAKQKCCQGQ